MTITDYQRSNRRILTDDGPSPARAASDVVIPQNTRRSILAIWAAAAVPMAVLSWIVAPRLSSSLHGGSPLQRALLVCLTAGLIWQFVLVASSSDRRRATCSCTGRGAGSL